MPDDLEEISKAARSAWEPAPRRGAGNRGQGGDDPAARAFGWGFWAGAGFWLAGAVVAMTLGTLAWIFVKLHEAMAR